jgi:hypothetical protein
MLPRAKQTVDDSLTALEIVLRSSYVPASPIGAVSRISSDARLKRGAA